MKKLVLRLVGLACIIGGPLIAFFLVYSNDMARLGRMFGVSIGDYFFDALEYSPGPPIVVLILGLVCGIGCFIASAKVKD